MEHRRLISHGIADRRFKSPAAAGAWLGGLQAQDYNSVLWVIGLRCSGVDVEDVTRAFIEGELVRTWLMRGTLQVAAAEDVRWMLQLLAPRLVFQSQRRLKQLEIDEPILSNSFDLLNRMLEGRNLMTRPEIFAELERGGISAIGQRGYHILRQAAFRAHICFGPRQDGIETYALLDEWIPRVSVKSREECLAEMAARYFRSHGPATLQDFIWWSSLTTADARAGVDLTSSQMVRESIDGTTYWSYEESRSNGGFSARAYLLPAYDEYYLGYKSREVVLKAEHDADKVSSGGVFRPMLVIDSQIAGVWKRMVKKKQVVVILDPFAPLDQADMESITAAAEAYASFLDLEIDVRLDG